MIHFLCLIISIGLLALLTRLGFKAPSKDMSIAIVGITILLSNIIAFILLGFGLNKKPNTYWNFLLMGIITSMIANAALVLVLLIYSNISKVVNVLSYNDAYYGYIGISLIAIIQCSIVAIFYKKYIIKNL